MDDSHRAHLEALRADAGKIDDRLSYLTKTASGKILKSSTIFIRDTAGDLSGIFAINFDITMLRAAQGTIQWICGVEPTAPGMPESASMPDQPRATARATSASQSSPAATLTSTPPHCGPASTSSGSVEQFTMPMSAPMTLRWLTDRFAGRPLDSHLIRTQWPTLFNPITYAGMWRLSASSMAWHCVR